MTSVLLTVYEIQRLRRNIRGVLEGKRERACMVHIGIMVNTLRRLPLSTNLECIKTKTKKWRQALLAKKWLTTNEKISV
jgi:hypothetical protein